MIGIKSKFIGIFFLIAFIFVANDLKSQQSDKTINGNLKRGKLINTTITQQMLNTYKLINRFGSKDGLPLGNVYVKQVNDSIFNTLIIVNNSKVVYEINHLDFWNTKGVDFDVAKNRERFYGFIIRMKKNDYLVIGYYSDYGKGVADDFTLEWNYENEIFEVPLTP